MSKSRTEMLNINEYVRVRLTDEGRRIHRKNHDDIFPKGSIPYLAPEEDKNGWSRWQLWELMRSFGPYLQNGFCVPFETEIEIIFP